jgi:sugar phosphate isomerase/epimerase
VRIKGSRQIKFFNRCIKIEVSSNLSTKSAIMITRKAFLRNMAGLAAGTLLTDKGIALTTNAKERAIGLQLYTLRNEMSKDPAGTLKKAAELGFREVENFGYNGKFFGMDAAAYKTLLSGLGLAPVSGHYMWGGATDNPPQGSIRKGWEQAVADAAALGQQYMVLAFLFPNERKTPDQYKKVAEDLNKAGEICKKSGIQMAYHNHDFEFQPIDGVLPFDLLMKETDASLVKAELDLYWAVKAGQPPVELFKQYKGRVALWHVKDMDKTEKKSFTEVGNGAIDFAPIFKAHKTSGMQHFFVEQDQCPGSPFDSITQSITYIKKNLVKLV